MPNGKCRYTRLFSRNGMRDRDGECQNAAFVGEEVSMSNTIYSGPVFDMARKQFQDVADYLQIPHDDRDRLLYPKRAIAVSCPIHSRRRQHGSVSGLSRAAPPDARADQGRHAVCAVGRYRRGRGPCGVDELEMRAGGPALWRRQGRHYGRPLQAVAARARRTVAPLHAGDDPVRRARRPTSWRPTWAPTSR